MEKIKLTNEEKDKIRIVKIKARIDDRKKFLRESEELRKEFKELSQKARKNNKFITISAKINMNERNKILSKSNKLDMTTSEYLRNLIREDLRKNGLQ